MFCWGVDTTHFPSCSPCNASQGHVPPNHSRTSYGTCKGPYAAFGGRSTCSLTSPSAKWLQEFQTSERASNLTVTIWKKQKCRVVWSHIPVLNWTYYTKQSPLSTGLRMKISQGHMLSKHVHLFHICSLCSLIPCHKEKCLLVTHVGWFVVAMQPICI